MRNLILRIQAFFAAKVGRCATCMRLSLSTAVAAWIVFGFGFLVWPEGPMQYLVGLAAAGLSALWMLHIAVFTFRKNRINIARHEPAVVDVGRRQAIGVLLRTAGAGIVASVPLVLWPTKSFAYCGQCSKNSHCGHGWSCKDTAAVGSGKTCWECVKD